MGFFATVAVKISCERYRRLPRCIKDNWITSNVFENDKLLTSPLETLFNISITQIPQRNQFSRSGVRRQILFEYHLYLPHVVRPIHR